MENVWKFNMDSNMELEGLKDCRAYKLREKLNSGEKLSREDRDWITREANGNSFFRDSVPLMGWRFYFGDIMKKYVVEQYGQVHICYGVDKTAVRKLQYGRVDTITEIPARAARRA